MHVLMHMHVLMKNSPSLLPQSSNRAVSPPGVIVSPLLLLHLPDSHHTSMGKSYLGYIIIPP